MPASLEDRVRDLENYVRVAVIVAAVFGVSGAWAAVSLSQAKKHLDELKDGAVSIKLEHEQALKELERSRVDGLEAIKKTANTELADIQTRAVPLVQGAVTQEIQQQIGVVRQEAQQQIGVVRQDMQKQISASKKWTTFIFDTASQTGVARNGANGYWQKALIEQDALVQSELK